MLAEDIPHFRLIFEKGVAETEEIEERVERILGRELSPPFPERGWGNNFSRSTEPGRGD